MNDKNIQILLTNDDSIHSPGLWAAAEALDTLGFVHVVAPLRQQTSTGHSMPATSTGIIEKMTLHVNGRDWDVFAVDGSPGQSVDHGVFDVIKEKPDLVVSGINYGENVGSALTVSGTIGAALEQLLWTSLPLQFPCKQGKNTILHIHQTLILALPGTLPN